MPSIKPITVIQPFSIQLTEHLYLIIRTTHIERIWCLS